MEEKQLVKVSLLAHLGLAVSAGYASFWLSKLYGSVAAIALALAVLAALNLAMERMLKRDRKWLLANGAFIYIFAWFVIWVYFFNL